MGRHAIDPWHRKCLAQKTLVKGDDARTGVTAILPYAGNIFQGKVPTVICADNGFCKQTGTMQIEGLFTIPVVLANTLSVRTATDGSQVFAEPRATGWMDMDREGALPGVRPVFRRSITLAR